MKKSVTNKLLALLLAVVLVFAQCYVVFAEDGTDNTVDEQYTWDLSEIYPTLEAYNADFAKVQDELVPQLAAYEGKLKSSKVIKECLEIDDQINMMMDKLYWYANFRLDLNQLDYEAAELSGRASALYTEVGAAEAFIVPELLGKSDRALELYINSPLLKDYKFYLEKLKDQKAHILSADAEAVLALAGDMAETPNNIFDKVMYADLGPAIMIKDDGTWEARNSQWMSEGREGREKYYVYSYERYKGHENTLAEALISEVKKNIFFAKARHYKSAEESALASKNIPTEILDNLVKMVGENLEPLHRYYDLRTRALGNDDLHLYDFAPAIIPGVDMSVTYEDAKTKILEGLAPLGEDYIAILNKAFNERWIDVYPRDNKYTGGYNLSAYNMHPYILMNYTDDINDMFTLAHELGHAVHGYWSAEYQSYRNSDKPPFNAEVASITNELIITKKMINEAKDDTEKMALIDNLLSNMDGTVYFQTMLQEYEKTIHDMAEAGEGLSTQVLQNLWQELCQKYWGPKFVPDEFYKNKGLTVPHFYMNFYVFSYATSFIAADPISQAIANGDEETITKYKDYLKAGGSDYPVELIKKVGVDLTSAEPYEAFFAEFNDYVDQLEQLMIEAGILTAE